MNVIIYGAGDAGSQIAKYCKGVNAYNLISFVDDKESLWGGAVEGIHVYPPSKLPDLIKQYEVKEIFIALPSVKRDQYQAILKRLSSLHVHLRSLPDPDEIIDDKVDLSDIKDVKVEDLLLRPSVEPIEKLLAQNISGKIVLVTGAGGSIGSELCRQIIKLNPKQILLVDHAEFNLYKISQELNLLSKKYYPPVNIAALLLSVNDQDQIYECIARYRPDTIYHAAAYKHVSIVENNIIAGVKNNIFGTLFLATSAYQLGVRSFTLISTDKAVRPTSIMGVTKRIAELILQSFASKKFIEHKKHSTIFSMVRFGNVLGSSGSVVPLFQSQINKGGPITVTHRDVTRYFMTISEASQLVIQASSLATGGDIFLLDMGDPVKIYDLAKNMIELAGMSLKSQDFPDGDIEIQITGLAKGEKLFEELLINGTPERTDHPKILVASENLIEWDILDNYLKELFTLLRDPKKVQESLIKLVPIFNEGGAFLAKNN